jgi:hypothetical protein
MEQPVTEIDFESFVSQNPELNDFDPKKFVAEERKKAMEAYEAEEARKAAAEASKQKQLTDLDTKEKVSEATSEQSMKAIEKTIEFTDFKVPTKIEIKKSSGHGHGIFSTSHITEGEVVEELRMFRLGWRATYQKDPVLNRYIIADTSCQCRDCSIHGPSVYMPMGYGGLYNYGFDSNIKAQFDFMNLRMKIIASEDIPAGKELLFDDSAFTPNNITSTEKLQ